MAELLPKVFVSRAAGAVTVDNQSAGAVEVKQRFSDNYRLDFDTLMTVSANAIKRLTVADDADLGLCSDNEAVEIPQPAKPDDVATSAVDVQAVPPESPPAAAATGNETEPETTQPGRFECLLGSSVQPATFPDLVVPLNGGDVVLRSSLAPEQPGYREVQLGDVVAAAHAITVMSVKAWNEQPEADREAAIADEIGFIKAGAQRFAEAQARQAAEARAIIEAAASDGVKRALSDKKKPGDA